MSVWTTAVIEHPWSEYTEQTIRQISLAATGEEETPRWFGCSEMSTAEGAFKAHGYVPYFLPRDFSLRFYGAILELQQAIRWSSFLTIPEKRRDFLHAAKSVALLTSAKDLIFMPEGVSDLFIDPRTTYKEFESLVAKKIGPPDLDMRRVYTEREVRKSAHTRVHYFHSSVADI